MNKIDVLEKQKAEKLLFIDYSVTLRREDVEGEEFG